MCIFAILFAVIALLLALYFILGKKTLKDIDGKHIVITGGSSGIGKYVAILSAKRGAHVSILARNKDRLESALQDIKKHADDHQIITAVSVDVSDYDSLKAEMKKLEEMKPIFGLVNCAGMAICGKIEDYSVENVDTLIKANWLGSFYPTQLVIPKMKERKEGFVVFTGSQVSLMGMFGYTVYSSCKFALRGLAESLDMEVRHLNIGVTLALPADTDTPGLKEENKTKPLETKLISEQGGLFTPKVVAEQILEDALKGKFFSYVGLESYLVTTACSGMSPFLTWTEVFVQLFILGTLRVICCFYLTKFHSIIRGCAQRIKKD